MNILSRCTRAVGFAAVLLLAGCLPALRGTPREQVAVLRGRDAEAVLCSGERVLLHAPRVEGDSVYGGWASTPAGDRQVVVALADIQQLRHVSMGPDRPKEFSVAGLIRNSLMIGFAGVVALMASLAIGGM